MAASIGEYTNLGMPSLATATGTRVDSAAKHIMACKVDAKLLHLWSNAAANDNSAQYMHSRKLEYCMHKDELVMNTTNALIPSSSYMSGAQAAYPLVVTTLAEMPEKTVRLLHIIYGSNTMTTFRQRAEAVAVQKRRDIFNVMEDADSANSDDLPKIKNILSQLPDLRCQGVALGQAFASYMSGDSVASVLIGGMVTISNGAWDMYPGDVVQWYFDSEEAFFYAKDTKGQGDELDHRAGSRKLRICSDVAFDRVLVAGDGVRGNFDERYKANVLNANVDTGNGKGYRQGWADRNMGFDVSGNHGYGSGNALYGKKDHKRIFRIKSYQPAWHREQEVAPPVDGSPSYLRFSADANPELVDVYGDKIRIFAKCISGGRAFDQVDIMLMTQSS